MEQAAMQLRGWDKLLVLSHASPDGDTLGSATGLVRALRGMGKQAFFACADTPGAKYQYLFAGDTPFAAPADFVPEKIVTVDVADKQLLGALKEKYTHIDLAIDHHATRAGFAANSWVDGHCAATAQMIYWLLRQMEVCITKEIADCLYTGISTDTGCFRYSNANASVYRAAADLIDAGANAAHINRVMFDTKTRACIEVERKVFASMEFLYGGKVVCAYIPHSLLQDTGALESDLEGIPSLVRGIEGVLIGLTLKEKEDGQWKASVRAISPVNAAEICSSLGGGGHKGAAGCSLNKDFAKAKNSILEACKAQLTALGLV